MSMWTDRDKALDELVAHEEGIKFQRLGVLLAKQRWPELIASEPKKDMGLDGYLPAPLAADGVGKGLACSLTASLAKLKQDIQRFRPHFKDVKYLLFATARKVSMIEKTKWAEEVTKEYGIELTILSREDIVSELMRPSNLSICRYLL